MTGPTASAGMDYALRLMERLDGRATHIDGSYVAASKPDPAEGDVQVTHDARQAMRFGHPEAARRFCAAGREARSDGRLMQLVCAYAIDVVAIRRAVPTAALIAGPTA